MLDRGGAGLNSNTLEAESGGLCEFKANRVYRVSSRMAVKVTQRNCLTKLKRKEKETVEKAGTCLLG